MCLHKADVSINFNEKKCNNLYRIMFNGIKIFIYILKNKEVECVLSVTSRITS